MAMHDPAHPGVILRELITDAALTPSDAADALGIGEVSLQALLRAEAPLSAELALRLAAVFGSTADAWLRIQARHDLARTLRDQPDLTAGLTRIDYRQ